MSANSQIEWTDHTFNPWEGCQRVGPGCDNCYAETRNARFGGGVAANWGPGAPRRRTSIRNWNSPLHWNAQAEAFHAQHGRRQRVFCASLADVFDNAIDPQWRYDLFNLILNTPNLDWLVLTKRIGNAARMIEETLPDNVKGLPEGHPLAWPWPHVWIGATIVNQEEAGRDIPKLLGMPAAKHFVSMEPLLGPIDLTRVVYPPYKQKDDLDPYVAYDALRGHMIGPDDVGLPKLDWVIVGGESGPGARPMHPDWARSLRDQCQTAGVPFLFKQHGEWAPALSGMWFYPLDGMPDFKPRAGGRDTQDFGDGLGAVRIGKKTGGRILDGREWNEVPA